jgi:3-hydroxybutyryl-CoA dehydrogenase
VIALTEHVTIGVVGAGVMGSGIAQTCAMAGHSVVCVDIERGALDHARSEIIDGRFGLRAAAGRGKIGPEHVDRVLERVRFTGDFDELAGIDVAIEAVPEQLGLKIGLFRQLDRVCQSTAILTSNSSGFPIIGMAAATERPEMVLGWHWASPAPVMRFAEVVTTDATSAGAVEVVTALAASMGKRPVIVHDRATNWGYVANRIYGAALVEARRVVEDGICDRDGVDQLMVDCFRWPVGPFTMVSRATDGWH